LIEPFLEDRSPFAVYRRYTAPTPPGFAEIVGDGFPVLHSITSIFITGSRSANLRALSLSNYEVLAFGMLLATDRSAFCIDFLQQSKGALLSPQGFNWEIRPFARLHDFRFWNRRQV